MVNMLCGCGEEGKYVHIIDGKEVYACNKYKRCLTYDEQRNKIQKLSSKLLRYERVLKQIVNVNAMDYEYKAWAKGILDE